MAGPLRRLLLAPELIKLRLELSRLTRTSQTHQPTDEGDDAAKCHACGELDPCPTQFSVDAALLRWNVEIRRLGKKMLA